MNLDLSHHCAYRSVHGGSTAYVQRLVLVKDTVVSGLYEPFFGDCRLYTCVMRASPVRFTGI